MGLLKPIMLKPPNLEVEGLLDIGMSGIPIKPQIPFLSGFPHNLLSGNRPNLDKQRNTELRGDFAEIRREVLKLPL